MTNETILDEQKAVAVICGNLSEDEAETRITGFENLKQVVLSL